MLFEFQSLLFPLIIPICLLLLYFIAWRRLGARFRVFLCQSGLDIDDLDGVWAYNNVR